VEDEFYQPGLIDQTSYDKNLAIKVTKTNLEVRISKKQEMGFGTTQSKSE